MVHALRKAAKSLNPGGVILEVHDLVDPPRIEIHSREGELFAGQLFSDNNFENQRHADQAIGEMIEEGSLRSDRAIVFENYIRSDTFEAFTDWLDEEWESAFIPEGTRRKVIDLIAQSGGEGEVVLRMVTRIMELTPAPHIK
jgi:hypothetical protein